MYGMRGHNSAFHPPYFLVFHSFLLNPLYLLPVFTTDFVYSSVYNSVYTFIFEDLVVIFSYQKNPLVIFGCPSFTFSRAPDFFVTCFYHGLNPL